MVLLAKIVFYFEIANNFTGFCIITTHERVFNVVILRQKNVKPTNDYENKSTHDNDVASADHGILSSESTNS